MHKMERKILGIDPGTNIMGYGVISADGNKPKLETMGVIMLNKINDPYEKLAIIHKRTTWLLDEFLPDECAIEAPFFGQNVQSMLKLGRAQGVAIAAAIAHQVPITEYAPRKIKLSITGNGDASKEQVAGILQKMLGFAELPKNLDATDGLAAAVCHFYQRIPSTTAKSCKSWADYVNRNPDKVVGRKS
ncbi:MAG: crossover junction endodeoxyribonuclease RuvC [Salinivirgaceae bacterium]|nr:crossover junction endodeoxyribonuclease RuvC [Salinivirgaceae bacterium]